MPERYSVIPTSLADRDHHYQVAMTRSIRNREPLLAALAATARQQGYRDWAHLEWCVLNTGVAPRAEVAEQALVLPAGVERLPDAGFQFLRVRIEGQVYVAAATKYGLWLSREVARQDMPEAIEMGFSAQLVWEDPETDYGVRVGPGYWLSKHGNQHQVSLRPLTRDAVRLMAETFGLATWKLPASHGFDEQDGVQSFYGSPAFAALCHWGAANPRLLGTLRSTQGSGCMGAWVEAARSGVPPSFERPVLH